MHDHASVRFMTMLPGVVWFSRHYRAMHWRTILRLAAGHRTWLAAGLLGALVIQIIPAHVCHAETPASLDLSGWGWCLEYRPIANVTANLAGTMTPRAEAPEISDLYLTGTFSFNLSDRTDSFDLELRGTKVRSLFFLRQVSGGETPLIAEFEGTWLSDNGTDYVACEGRIAVPLANHVAKPYIFVLRTTGVDVPGREPGNWVQDLEYSIGRLTLAFDRVADRLVDYGDNIKRMAGDVLTEIAVMFREVRRLGTPYFR